MNWLNGALQALSVLTLAASVLGSSFAFGQGASGFGNVIEADQNCMDDAPLDERMAAEGKELGDFEYSLDEAFEGYMEQCVWAMLQRFALPGLPNPMSVFGGRGGGNRCSAGGFLTDTLKGSLGEYARESQIYNEIERQKGELSNALQNGIKSAQDGLRAEQQGQP